MRLCILPTIAAVRDFGVTAVLSLILALLVFCSLVLSSNREFNSDSENTVVDFLFLSVDFLGGSFSSVLSLGLTCSVFSVTLCIGVEALTFCTGIIFGACYTLFFWTYSFGFALIIGVLVI